MRQSHFTHGQTGCQPVAGIRLNFNCRDEIVPVLAALQHVYCQPELRDEILALVASDVNGDSRADRGRTGFSYWQITVLTAVRLGCNFNYDRLQDLAENHHNLRCMMQLGRPDKTSFSWRRICDNICHLKPQTIARISQLIAGEGHRLDPAAAAAARVDSTVIETRIHHPSESSMIRDGLRVILRVSHRLARDLRLPGWRQAAHLLNQARGLHREIARASASRKRNSKQTQKTCYGELLTLAETIVKRAENLAETAENLVKTVDAAGIRQLCQVQEIRTFVERTRHVMGTARRRVMHGEKIPHEDKLFSIFEPHTQLYRRGKAGQPNQFGRLVMFFEDGAGFITHHYLMGRHELDKEAAVEQTRIVQARLKNAIKRISFDRGFDSELNQRELKEIVPEVCLPKRGANEYACQMAEASEEFAAARRRHSGIESEIGALQSGNGLKRCRDRGELGFERYLSLAVLGRNLHVLGKLLIAREAPDSAAAYSQRGRAA